MTPASVAIVAAFSLLGVGLYGLLIARNLIKLVIMLQILAKAAALLLVAAGQMSGQLHLGQSLALTVIVADTLVAVFALALVVQVRRQVGTLDVKALSTLKR